MGGGGDRGGSSGVGGLGGGGGGRGGGGGPRGGEGRRGGGGGGSGPLDIEQPERPYPPERWEATRPAYLHRMQPNGGLPGGAAVRWPPERQPAAGQVAGESPCGGVVNQ